MLKRWLIVALSVFIGLNTAYGDWSDDIRITNDTANSYRPSIDIDSKDNLHVIWIENNGVYYTKLAPGGATLVSPKVITPLWPSASLEDFRKDRGRPTISVDSDDNCVVAFLDFSDYSEGTPPESSTRTINYLKLDNSGNVIASKFNVGLGYAPNDPIRSYNPDITVNSTNHALIVWEGYTSHNIEPGDRELYYAEFDVNGNMIDGPKRLTEDIGSYIVNAYPSVDTDYLDRNHFMSGSGSNIAYTVMTKDGIKLKDNLIIPESSGGQWVDVAADSQNIHAVWWDMLMNQLYYSKRDVDGNTIVFPKAILSMSPTNVGRPEMDIGPASYIYNIHLALDFTTLSDTNSLFYMLLNNSGSTNISETKFVTSGENPGKNPWGPDIAVDSENCAHIVWVDQRDGNEEIYYITSCSDAIPPEGPLDFGDAPLSYSTLLKDNGARHNITEGIHLGSLIDDEQDGQPTDLDDANGVDDEDGVVFLNPLEIGTSANISVDASVEGYLNAWIDFNADGDWSDSGEQIFADEVLLAGANTLNFDVSAGAAEGDTYSRFRFNTQGGLRFNGSADDGEVEDYMVEVLAHKPPKPVKKSQPDRNFDSLEVGSDSAIAINNAMGPRLWTLAENNLEIKKIQNSGECECCPGSSDCCTKYNRDTITVGNRDAMAIGSASATNNVMVAANQK